MEIEVTFSNLRTTFPIRWVGVKNVMISIHANYDTLLYVQAQLYFKVLYDTYRDICMNSSFPSGRSDCQLCYKECSHNQQSIERDLCNKWSHAMCCLISESEYYELESLSNSGKLKWQCPLCELKLLITHFPIPWKVFLKTLAKLHDNKSLSSKLCFNIIDSLPPLKTHKEPNFDLYNTDIKAFEVLQSYNSKNVRPLMTSTNGNCFYCSISILLCGNETLSTELRARTFIELRTMKNWFAKKTHQSILFAASGRTYEESLDCCHDREWSDACHIQALSNVLQRKIQCVVPPKNGLFDMPQQILSRIWQPRSESISQAPLIILLYRLNNITERWYRGLLLIILFRW